MRNIKTLKILYLLLAIAISLIVFTSCSTKDISTKPTNTASSVANDADNETEIYSETESRAFSGEKAAPTDAPQKIAEENNQKNVKQSNTENQTTEKTVSSDNAETNKTDNTQNKPSETQSTQIQVPEDTNNSNHSEATIEQQNNQAQDNPQKTNICSFIVDCSKAVNLPDLSPDLKNVLPANGIIYSSGSTEFVPGESVFDLLRRTMKDNNVPVEFSSSPLYGSKYIEGINSLYEFDCGELSGWVFYVNGERLNYGSDKRVIKPGDDIRWYYTLELGNDISL